LVTNAGHREDAVFGDIQGYIFRLKPVEFREGGAA
jgi:hypothetical protein